MRIKLNDKLLEALKAIYKEEDTHGIPIGLLEDLCYFGYAYRTDDIYYLTKQGLEYIQEIQKQ